MTASEVVIEYPAVRARSNAAEPIAALSVATVRS